eukprot:TRINITY_DN4842_c0_g2_i2.p1 TRINITY_DN4842_c0_g2~~TRINITY_DN4842_c0_g2_i2.p1  ORF type:complete len:107 (+),score=14.56 TRINITY_DN4842_c0_g2_i2:107-427(+)
MLWILFTSHSLLRPASFIRMRHIVVVGMGIFYIVYVVTERPKRSRILKEFYATYTPYPKEHQDALGAVYRKRQMLSEFASDAKAERAKLKRKMMIEADKLVDVRAL